MNKYEDLLIMGCDIFFRQSHIFIYIWCPKICSHGNSPPVNLPLAEICQPEICPPGGKLTTVVLEAVC